MFSKSSHNRYNTNKDNFLTLEELKRMMEILGAPQTHLGLKQMIKEVDEDGDGRLSFREFLLVYRKAKAGELHEDSGLAKLAMLTEVDVDKVGVNGAKEFFEAKVNYDNSCLLVKEINFLVRQIEELSKKSKFEDEIRQEQEERKRLEEEKAMRRQHFLEKAAVFK